MKLLISFFCALLFGTGWGLTGIFLGPAVANILTFEPKIFAFIGMMIISMFSARLILKAKDSLNTSIKMEKSSAR